MAILEETTEETTITTEISDTERRLEQLLENLGRSQLLGRVCCHNTHTTLAPILAIPTALYSTLMLNALLQKPFVQLSEINKMLLLANPELLCNIKMFYNELENPDLTYFMWLIEPSLNLATLQDFIAHNLSLTFSEALSEFLVNNFSPSFIRAVSYSTLPTVFLTDDFESFPTNWTVGSGNGGTFVKSSAQAHAGTYSALSDSQGNAAYAYAYRNLTAITQNFHYQIWIYPLSGITYDGILVCEPYNGTTVSFRVIVQTVSGTTYLRLGDPQSGSPLTICSLNLDAWNKIDVYYIRATGVLHIYLNGVKQDTNWTNEVVANISPNRFYLGDVSGTTTKYNGKLYYDDLLLDNASE
jgi:hypothetical protein